MVGGKKWNYYSGRVPGWITEAYAKSPAGCCWLDSHESLLESISISESIQFSSSRIWQGRFAFFFSGHSSKNWGTWKILRLKIEWREGFRQQRLSGPLPQSRSPKRCAQRCGAKQLSLNPSVVSVVSACFNSLNGLVVGKLGIITGNLRCL